MSILSQTVDSNLETSAAGRFLSKFGRELVTGVALTAATLGIGATTAQAQQAQNVSATTTSPAYQQAYNASSAKFMQPVPSTNPDTQIAKELAKANAILEGVKEAYLQGDDATKGAIDGVIARAAPIVQQSTYRIVAQHNQVMQPTDPKLSTIETMQAQIDQAGAVAVPASEYAQAKQTTEKPSFIQQHGTAVGAGAGMALGIALHATPVGMIGLGAAGALTGHLLGGGKPKHDFAAQSAQNNGSATALVDANPAWYISQAVQQVAVVASSTAAPPQLHQRPNTDSAANHGGSSVSPTATLVSAAGSRNQQTASATAPGGLPD